VVSRSTGFGSRQSLTLFVLRPAGRGCIPFALFSFMGTLFVFRRPVVSSARGIPFGRPSSFPKSADHVRFFRFFCWKLAILRIFPTTCTRNVAFRPVFPLFFLQFFTAAGDWPLWASNSKDQTPRTPRRRRFVLIFCIPAVPYLLSLRYYHHTPGQGQILRLNGSLFSGLSGRSPQKVLQLFSKESGGLPVNSCHLPLNLKILSARCNGPTLKVPLRPLVRALDRRLNE